ncbi:CheY-like chemotaxis protein [Paraburkholderia sp. UCT70]
MQRTVGVYLSVAMMVVDDNRDALEALGLLLEVEGHEVTTSDNGSDAIRLMSERRPDVALVDIGMPVMDGFEVAHLVWLDPNFNDVVLVALTGYAAESDKSRALAAGFDYHLTSHFRWTSSSTYFPAS